MTTLLAGVAESGFFANASYVPPTTHQWRRVAVVLLLGLLANLIVCRISRAAVYSWQVSAGDWSQATNWGGTVPGGADSAYIVNGGSATITQLGETCNVLSLGSSAGSGTVLMTGGSLAINFDAYVGDSGNGVFTQSGGTNSGIYDLYLGYNLGSSGFYSLSGNGVLSPAFESVGFSGTGVVEQSGESIASFSVLNLGTNAGSTGSYCLSGNALLSESQGVFGYLGSGSFTQTGGTNTGGACYLGYSAGGVGTYNLIAGQMKQFAYVGYSGSGAFFQSGGTSNSNLVIGYFAASNGLYGLSGSGLLSNQSCILGGSGIGVFTQSGGTAAIDNSLTIGFDAGGTGTYSLTGGLLTQQYCYVGYSGTGNFTQSGGTDVVGSTLYVGYGTGSSGSYSLAGSGLLSAGTENVGAQSAGSFHQSGGANTASLLNIGGSGAYLLQGGTLQVTGNLSNAGIFGGGSSPATLNAGGILNLTSGTWQNLSAVSLNMSANSLLIVPPGFNPSANFAAYTNPGMIHTAGTTLSVASGQGFGGQGTISDPVTCQGTITAMPGGGINFGSGLIVSGNGNVNLGSGTLTVNDIVSGISSGSLSAGYQLIGNSGSGMFTQTGGANTISNNLILGNNPGDSGSYVLSGRGRISANFEYLGQYGFGSFSQSGGTNSAALNGIILGEYAGSSGTYNLSGSGLLSAAFEYVAGAGTGGVVQTGGTNSVGALFVGGYYGVGDGSGSYNLSGNGRLLQQSCFVGDLGPGTFVQSGGTNLLSNSLYLGISNSGTYNLNGNSLLSSASEYIGTNSTAMFQQNGGANTVSLLSIGSSGEYLLHGGTLAVAGDMSNVGVFDGGNSPATLYAAGILDLTSGTWHNLSALSLSMGSNSLLIVPAGFDTSTDFGSYTTLGLTHTAGTTLSVSEGQNVTGLGAINDFVDCGGTVAAINGGMNLNGGLALSSGVVALGNGSLTVNIGNSVISGGSLSSAVVLVGNMGSGTLTQSGGVNTNAILYLGNTPGDSGTYVFSGGLLSQGSIYVGNSGTGSFTQTGGTASGSSLVIGANAGATGTFALSGSGYLGPFNITLGSSGSGIFNQSGGTVVANMVVGSNVGSSGAYNLTGNGLLSASYISLGYTGTGSVVQSGGTVSVGNYFSLASGTSALGLYSLSGSGLLSAPNEEIGDYGPAIFTQSGGTNSVTSLMLGSGNTGNGTYNLNGGILSADSETVSFSGSGYFFQSGGTNTVGTLNVGSFLAGSNGRYMLSGSGVLSATTENIGSDPSNPATIQQSGGTNTVSILSINTGSSYALDSGVLQVTGNLSNAGIFHGGTGATLDVAGILDLTTGSWQNLQDISLNVAADSLVIVPPGFNLSTGFAQYSTLGLTHTAGTTLNIASGQTIIGEGTINDFVNCQGTISALPGGGINLSGGLSYSGSGAVNLGTGALTIANTAFTLGGGSLSAYYQYIGYSGTGVFNQSGGTNTALGVYLGYNPRDNGTYNLNGGLLIFTVLESVQGTGSFNYNGGLLQAGGGFYGGVPIALNVAGGSAAIDTNGYSGGLYGPISGSDALVVLNSGTLTLTGSNTYSGGTVVLGSAVSVTDDDNLGTGSLTLDGGTLQTTDGAPFATSKTLNIITSGAIAAGNSAGTTFNGPITGSGNLIKTGTAALTLAGSNSFSGATFVNQGMLAVNSSLTGPVTVNAGGTLAGTGVAGPVTLASGGQLHPGAALGYVGSNATAAGTLTVGSLNMMPLSALDFDIASPGIVSQGQNDLLVVQGDVTLNGTLNLNASLQDYGAGTYTLMEFGGNLTYDGLQLESTPPFICPSETITSAPMSSNVLGSGMYDYQLEFSPASGGTLASMNLIVTALAEPNSFLLLAPLVAICVGVALRRPWRR